MDPVTILAIAKGSYSAIKSGIAVGKEMQGMAKDLASLWKACADLTHMAAKPPVSSMLSGKTFEQVAMEAYEAKAEALKLVHDIKMEFIAKHGLEGWDAIQSMVIKLKKEQKRLQEEEKKRQEELMNDIFFALTIGAGVLTIFAIVVFAILIIV